MKYYLDEVNSSLQVRKKVVSNTNFEFSCSRFFQIGQSKKLFLLQMILSFELPFALIPLLKFTSCKTKMGLYANSYAVRTRRRLSSYYLDSCLAFMYAWIT